MNHGKSEHRFDFVEIDPFGCPSEFIDSAIQSININGVISGGHTHMKRSWVSLQR